MSYTETGDKPVAAAEHKTAVWGCTAAAYDIREAEVGAAAEAKLVETAEEVAGYKIVVDLG